MVKKFSFLLLTTLKKHHFLCQIRRTWWVFTTKFITVGTRFTANVRNMRVPGLFHQSGLLWKLPGKMSGSKPSVVYRCLMIVRNWEAAHYKPSVYLIRHLQSKSQCHQSQLPCQEWALSILELLNIYIVFPKSPDLRRALRSKANVFGVSTHSFLSSHPPCLSSGIPSFNFF